MTGRMLVAGVGNIFLGDDGFGVEVANRLATAGLPDWVRVADYGISGMHLAYDLADGFETTILVDATPRGDDPGTVYVMELDPAAPSATAAPEPGRGIPLLDGHGMQPDVVFGMLNLLGAEAGRVLLVGCEPASVDERIGLSEPVTAAVDEAVRIVLDLVRAAEADGATGTVAEGGRPVSDGSQPAGSGSPPSGADGLPAEADRQPAAGSSHRS
ncbi:MAG TPA: hydrogenase maturation protease [Streptosporangiaceae bacterium]|nr:hydrogenase maturation protease [Streptosporangiaceae bacterium]